MALVVVHQSRHSLRGRGQGFCDYNTKALALKTKTMGGGGLKIVHNCVTSFMDDRDPLTQEFHF